MAHTYSNPAQPVQPNENFMGKSMWDLVQRFHGWYGVYKAFIDEMSDEQRSQCREKLNVAAIIQFQTHRSFFKNGEADLKKILGSWDNV